MPDGRVASHMVRSGEDVPQLEMGGARVEFIGPNVVYIPEIRRSVLADVQFGTLDHQPGYEYLLDEFLPLGSREFDEFLSTRKVVCQPSRVRDGGTVRVTSNLADRIVEEHEATGSVAQPADRRRYQLAQLLTDIDLQVSLDLPRTFVVSMRALAVSDPDAAAKKFQEELRRRGYLGCTVVAGAFSRSRAWARQSIERWSSDVSPATVTIPAEVIGKKLLLYSDAEGQRTTRSWHVVGPLLAAQQLYQLHKLVAERGPSIVAIALEAELGILDLDIANGNSYAIPRITYHAGSADIRLPPASSPVTLGMLSATGRVALQEIAGMVDEVMVDGRVVASSVRISDKYALVNNHVFGNGVVTIGGSPVLQSRMLGKDLWLVRRQGLTLPAAWPLRLPQEGEQVILCYRAPGGLQVTSPLTVRVTDGVTMSMSIVSELGPGMSGAAVVGLADMALLGVYEGVGVSNALATVFSQETFADVHIAETSSSVSHSSAADAVGTVYQRFKHRGLGRYIDVVMGSCQPLYSRGVHVGLGYTNGRDLYTTCDPGVYPLSLGRDGRPLVFEAVGDFRFRTLAGEIDTPGPMLYRKPNYFEKVAIVGRDEQGPYYSPTSRVVHIGVGSKNFSLEGFPEDDTLPYVGGLVVALSDSAVIGQFVRRTVSESLGEVEFCVNVLAEHVTQSTPKVAAEIDHVEVIAKAFPMLSPGVWDAGLVREVFTHASAQRYPDSRFFNAGFSPIAYVGDSALKLAMGMQLRELAIPHSRWQTLIQRVQSNAALARVCVDRGLSSGLILGHGMGRPPETSKIYADLLEALAGAVYLSETFETFCEFTQSIGITAVVSDDFDSG